MRRLTSFAVACGTALLLTAPAQAQLNGSHSLGDFGVQSGSQPTPGFYAALFYYRYDTDTIKNADGDTVRVSPSSPSSIGLSAAAPIAWYVSKAKVLGANYGAMVLDFEVVSQVEDGHAVVSEAARLTPDVIVTDISMPGLDGIEAAVLIRRRDPEARIVFVTVHSEPALVERGLAAGALGYVLKDGARDELVSAVQAALDGERFIGSALR